MAELAQWELRFRSALAPGNGTDAAHDLGHLLRVRAAALALTACEGADVRVVLPAVWFHDCVSLPKDHADTAKASTLSAERALNILRGLNYPPEFYEGIHHAIEAHSFSARVTPRTIEARVVQDADRLDALGAIGIARCFTVGGRLNRPICDADDPFALRRSPDDTRFTLDHFHRKLLTLAGTMQTAAGREEADRRTEYLRGYLRQLASEFGVECETDAFFGAKPGQPSCDRPTTTD